METLTPATSTKPRRQERPHRAPHVPGPELEAPRRFHAGSGVRWWEWALYLAIVGLGVIVVIGPGNLSWDGAFVGWAFGDPSVPVPPGDHIQVAYQTWLWRDALTSLSHFPWTDPYLYAASGVVSSQGSGWPLVLLSVPLDVLFGPVAAYNVLVYLAFALGAVCTAAWTRSLGISKWGAAVAGIAFAFAPFRLVQGTAHINALLAWMFPLLLLCLEQALRGPDRRARRWAWAAVVVQVSIVGSGELHYLVFSGLLVGGYVLLRAPGAGRERLRLLVVPAAAMAIGSMVVITLMYVFLVAPSPETGGRTVEDAAKYAPRFGDLLRRELTWSRMERYAYPGTVIAVGAVFGAVVAISRRRTRWLGIGLLAGLLVWGFLAFGPGLEGQPALQSLYRLVPGLSFSRVPGRILILAALFLAAFLGFAVDALRGRGPRRIAAVAAVAMVLILLDTPRGIFRDLPADAAPYRDVEPGATILELPPFDPGHGSGSPYSFHVMQHPGPRFGGYYLMAKPEADVARRRAVPLVERPWDECLWQEVADDYDLHYVAVHTSLFGERPMWDADPEAIIAALDWSPAFFPLSDHDGVRVFKVRPDALVCVPVTSRPQDRQKIE